MVDVEISTGNRVLIVLGLELTYNIEADRAECTRIYKMCSRHIYVCVM
jgi:hypothetical protein